MDLILPPDQQSITSLLLMHSLPCSNFHKFKCIVPLLLEVAKIISPSCTKQRRQNKCPYFQLPSVSQPFLLLRPIPQILTTSFPFPVIHSFHMFCTCHSTKPLSLVPQYFSYSNVYSHPAAQFFLLLKEFAQPASILLCTVTLFCSHQNKINADAFYLQTRRVSFFSQAQIWLFNVLIMLQPFCSSCQLKQLKSPSNEPSGGEVPARYLAILVPRGKNIGAYQTFVFHHETLRESITQMMVPFLHLLWGPRITIPILHTQERQKNLDRKPK